MTTELVFEIPGPEAPGYLRRQRRYMELQRLMAEGRAMEEGLIDGQGEATQPDTQTALDIATLGVDVIDQMVDFMLDYVVEPARDEARELLLDMSEQEFQDTFQSFSKNAIRRTSKSSAMSGAGGRGRPTARRGRQRS